MILTPTILATLSVYQERKGGDPTRTTVLRNTFERQMRIRFSKIAAEIRKAVSVEDVFGLKAVQVNTPAAQAFAFPRSADKVDAFMRWLNEMIDRDILQVGFMNQMGRPIDQAWTNIYIEDSYKRGVQRARYEMIKAGYDIPSLEATGGIGASMSTPFHADRLGALYTRTFNDLKGITDNMNTQISRVLTEGLMNGDHPSMLARKMNAVIKGGGAELGITDTLGRHIPAERRARMLARTEIIRAHHLATIQEYKNWELEGVRVQAEWSTAADGRVCERCAGLQGKVYTLDEIQGMIPVHPNCRCLVLPLSMKDEEGKQEPEKLWDDVTRKDISNPYSHSSDKLDDIGIARVDWNDISKEAAVKQINIIGDTIGNDILGKIPQLKNMVQQNSSVYFDIQAHSKWAKGLQDALATYTPADYTITLGKQVLTRTTWTGVQQGAHNIGGGVLRSSISHEYGHHVWFKMLEYEQKQAFGKAYNSIPKSDFIKKVSKYGTTDRTEAFAECFSLYTHPKYVKGMLPKEIEDFFINVIGKRIDL